MPNPPAPGTTWCIVRVFSDGRREFVTLAGEPWQGSEEKARSRASVMQQEEPEVTFVVTALPTSAPKPT